jgi:amidase
VRAVEDAAALLASLGHHVDGSYPAALDEAGFAHHFGVVFQGFTAQALDWWRREAGIELDAEGVEPLTWVMAEMGRALSAPAYLASVEWLQGYARRVASWWPERDVLLTPTLPEPPQRLGGYQVRDGDVRAAAVRAVKTVTYTAPFNATGQPAISLPLYWSSGGLPIGVQLVAAFGREDVLVRLASQLERARPWLDRKPTIHA